jgi:hypothetical protein
MSSLLTVHDLKYEHTLLTVTHCLTHLFVWIFQALRFVGLLCGSCCIYMPLLIVNPTNVLSDFPVTLPSFLSSSIWDDLRNSVAEKLWLLTTRIYTWAEQLTRGEGLSCYDHIHESEADNATFLANMLRSTCIAVEDHLAADKQLKLANLEAL